MDKLWHCTGPPTTNSRCSTHSPNKSAAADIDPGEPEGCAPRGARQVREKERCRWNPQAANGTAAVEGQPFQTWKLEIWPAGHPVFAVMFSLK